MSPPSLSTARAGFTVVELMVTIAILAILLGIAAPNLRDFILDVRLTGQANDLMGDLMLARSEAVKRDVTVAVCARKKNDKAGEAPSCTNGNQWDNGWMVVVDADTDGDMDTGTFPLTTKEPLSGDNKIGHKGAGPKGAIVYTPTGKITNAAATVFNMCDSRGKGRQITIQPIGRATVTKVEANCSTT